MNSRRLKELVAFSGKTDSFPLFKMRFQNKIVGDTQIYALFLMYKIARYTKVFTEEVRSFYFDDATYSEISEVFGVSESVAKNNVYRQTKKYFEIIGRDLLGECMDELIDDDEARLIVRDLEEKYNELDKLDKPLEDYFNENIFLGYEYSYEFNEVSDEQFKMIRDVMTRLSKPAVKYLYDRQEKVLVNYVVYLLNSHDDDLDEVSLERKKSLILFLRLEEYFGK